MDTAPNQRPGSPAAPDGHVTIDLPCTRCGYNLRTLDASATCPECGHPVNASLRGDVLCCADPEWVAGLARGLRLSLLALAAFVVASFIAQLATNPMILGGATTTVFPANWLRTSMATQLIISAVCGIPVMIGLLKLTRREPSQVGQPERLTARRVLRVCTFLLPALVLGQSLMQLGNWNPAAWLPTVGTGPAPAPPLGGIAISLLLQVGSSLLYMAFILAFIRHLRTLLRRIPRPGLARFATVEFWGTLATSVFSLLVMCVMTLAIAPMMAALAAPPATAPAITASQPSASPTITFTTQPRRVAIVRRATTSMPATFTPPNIMPLALLVGIFGIISGCSGFVFGIAGIVFVILACVAFFRAAADAAVFTRAPGPIEPPDLPAAR